MRATPRQGVLTFVRGVVNVGWSRAAETPKYVPGAIIRRFWGGPSTLRLGARLA